MDSALKNRLRLKLIKRVAEKEKIKVRWDSTSSFHHTTNSFYPLRLQVSIFRAPEIPLGLLWFIQFVPTA